MDLLSIFEYSSENSPKRFTFVKSINRGGISTNLVLAAPITKHETHKVVIKIETLRSLLELTCYSGRRTERT